MWLKREWVSEHTVWRPTRHSIVIETDKTESMLRSNDETMRQVLI